jgi:hypothetical protein
VETEGDEPVCVKWKWARILLQDVKNLQLESGGCDKWRILHAGIFLKGSVVTEMLIKVSREKWEMCIKGTVLVPLCYVDNVVEQTDIDC